MKRCRNFHIVFHPSDLLPTRRKLRTTRQIYIKSDIDMYMSYGWGVRLVKT